mgnify:CR=1 FL=1
MIIVQSLTNSSVDIIINENEIKGISMDFDSTYSYMVDFVYSKDGTISGIIIRHNERDKYTFTPDEN